MSAIRPAQPLAPILSQSGSTVTIVAAAPDDIVRYTLDGSAPTINSTKYAAPFVLTQSKTVRATAFRPVPSVPASWNFTVALTPAQQFVAACLATVDGSPCGDDVLLFDADHYSVTGGIGTLISAAGRSITWTAPSAAATNDLSIVTDASGPNGLPYMASGGTAGTLVASANQTVAWYCAVFRSPPGQTTFNNYGAIIEETTAVSHRLGYFNAGGTSMLENGSPLYKNGTQLSSASSSLSPINQWMLLSVLTGHPSISQILQLLALENTYFIKLHLAALAIRYTDPTADQQTALEAAASTFTGIALAS